MVQEVDNTKVFFCGIAVIVATFVMILVTAFQNPAVDQAYEQVGKGKTAASAEVQVAN